MVFSTTTFLFLFLPLVLILYYNPVLKKRKLKNNILLIFSIIFYAWGEPVYVLLIIFSIIVNWFLGLMVNKYKNHNLGKLTIFISILYNIGLLFIFKYLNFVLKNMGMLFNKEIPILNIALPIGISFYSFQALSYIIDIYRGNEAVQKNILDVGLYITLFPQLIAGPIVRYKTISDEIQNRKETKVDFYDGINRFIIGLSKKVIIANNLALVADKSFDNINNLSVAMSWLGAIAYTFQIYFDFSGYSDMAIGLGKMFGFHFLENFNYPYIANSITDFWRRWHISLSSWFRDYVYIPLGGNRVKSKIRLVFNLFIVWLLTGIWHGANWTFICWGGGYFLLLVIEKFTNFPDKLKRFSHIYTLFFVMINWVIFRSVNMNFAISYIKTMLGITKASFVDGAFYLYFDNFKIYFLIAIICSLPFKDWIKTHFINYEWLKNIFYILFMAFILIITLSFMVKNSYNPFIYFNF